MTGAASGLGAAGGLAAAFALAALLVAGAQAAAPAIPAARLAEGGRLFRSMGCYQCHGYAGQGGLTTGPALTSHRMTGQVAMRYVRAPVGVMPPFSRSLLPDDQLALILDYVATLTPGKPASAIPSLRAVGARSDVTR